jgi:hypothetical protein
MKRGTVSTGAVLSRPSTSKTTHSSSTVPVSENAHDVSPSTAVLRWMRIGEPAGVSCVKPVKVSVPMEPCPNATSSVFPAVVAEPSVTLLLVLVLPLLRCRMLYGNPGTPLLGRPGASGQARTTVPVVNADWVCANRYTV